MTFVRLRYFRACNFKYVAIEWEPPSCYGDAKITGYKVYVNGVVEALLGADQQTYSFTHGRWCREYAFQVQVRTTLKSLTVGTARALRSAVW